LLFLTLLIAIFFFAVIYGAAFLSMTVIMKAKPDFGERMEEQPWLSTLIISPVVALTSLLLIFFISQGNPGSYGLKGIPLGDLLFLSAIGFIIAMILMFIGEIALLSMKVQRSPWLTGDKTREQLVAALLLVIFPSVSEELVFRGVIQSFVDSQEVISGQPAFIVTPGVIAGAMLFGVVHVTLVSQKHVLEVVITVVIALILGIIAGIFLNSSGSLLPAIVLHASFNLLGVIVEKVWTGNRSSLSLER
jgi:membrane protease YdiL (CAAX protease family)